MKKHDTESRKIFFVSLGCDKNLVDSEIMLGLLAKRGYLFTDDETEAEIAVVNTCCFVNDAKEESIQSLLEMAELKKTGRLVLLVAAGCLAQRYQEEIREEIPEVDMILGTTAIDKIADAVDSALSGKSQNYFSDINVPLSGNRSKRMITTGGHYAYLKIAEGCDKHCTYCIIPKIRGNYRSIPVESLIQEARGLAEDGVKELILVAQETTLYGVDLYGKKSLPYLLRELCRIDGLKWIRILYCYPEEITDELIDVIKSEEKKCHYLDIPIQHASDPVLKRMGRRTSQEQLRAVIGKLRHRVPDICLRTTLITGFPGESGEDYEELYRFVNEMEFDRLGIFTYSAEEGTPAADMEDQISEEIKELRRDELMELQQAIAFEKAEDMAKSRPVVDAFIEGRLPEEGVYIARTYKDAPGVDGLLFLHDDRELMSGDFVRARITGSHEYDLTGVIWDEFAE